MTECKPFYWSTFYSYIQSGKDDVDRHLMNLRDHDERVWSRVKTYFRQISDKLWPRKKKRTPDEVLQVFGAEMKNKTGMTLTQVSY